VPQGAQHIKVVSCSLHQLWCCWLLLSPLSVECCCWLCRWGACNDVKQALTTCLAEEKKIVR